MVREAHLIEVLQGVNLNMLGWRDRGLYGRATLPELEREIDEWASALDLRVRHFQTNFEGAMVERLQGLRDPQDEPCAGIVINPGAWTHYAWAIRDALEIAALPAVEVHLSDTKAREPWRHLSVVEDLCVATFAGHGSDGYRLALECLREKLDEGRSPSARGQKPDGALSPAAPGPGGESAS